MSTRHRALWQALAAEFHPSEVRSRSQGGRTFSYITARVAMNRLDEVLGAENWKDEYSETEKGLKCRLWFRLPDAEEWLWKEDGGAAAGMGEADNDEKSGYSDAFKRAAVKLGVARYLYNDGVPIYPAEPEPPKPHPQGKNNLHPNNSGFHNGQYASPEQTKKYLDRLKEKVKAVNDQWADFWVNHETGELPTAKECTVDLMSIFQADGHLVKWLVETGQLDRDALEKNGKVAHLGRHAAIILGRDKADIRAMNLELERYMGQCFDDRKDAVYRKYPELAPDGYAEELREAAGLGEDREGRDDTAPGDPAAGDVPEDGRALCDWLKDQEERYGAGVSKYVNGWGKLQGFPAPMVDWDRDQARLAHAEAVRKLQALSGYQAEARPEALAN
jgi:hypothetical protein